ncbi:dynactin, subunit p25 [Atractiella rhizophila]|nr:dynactin, subunit p25 [Atractiella rhizophila]
MASAVAYKKADYIETDTGNKVSRKCVICGSQNIMLGGKTIIQNAIIRGDLRRSSAPTVGSAAVHSIVISIGKYCLISDGVVVRPSYKTYKGVFSYYPMKVGDNVHIGANTVLEAASVGNGVEIGKNCVIGRFSILKDNCKIADNSIVTPNTVVPSLCVYGGQPARFIEELPEVTPEVVEQKTKSYYARFLPE